MNPFIKIDLILKTTLHFFQANEDGSEISGHLYE